jgi:hypothetical protein
MNAAMRLRAVEPATAEADTDSLRQCAHALELLLTHRGNPSVEVERAGSAARTHIRWRSVMSAFGGKADIPSCIAHVCFES